MSRKTSSYIDGFVALGLVMFFMLFFFALTS